jgi:hypothetical protein
MQNKGKEPIVTAWDLALQTSNEKAVDALLKLQIEDENGDQMSYFENYLKTSDIKVSGLSRFPCKKGFHSSCMHVY